MAELHALQVMEENAGTQFDPEVASIALSMFREMRHHQLNPASEKFQVELVRVSAS